MRGIYMISGEIEFRIVDDNEINVENVNGIMPTRMLRKGEIKKFGRESKNQWSHEEHFNNIDEFEILFSRMLKKLVEKREYIHHIMEIYEYVGITIYLRSDFGQLGWEFTPEMISMMALLGCEVSVDILSGGMVLDI